MARKKTRSPAQKRNDKRLGQMAKRRARKRTNRDKPRRRRSTVRKTIKRRTRRTSVVKRRRSRTPVRKRSITSKIPFVNNPTVRKVATGIGLATIGTTVIALVAPSIASNPIVKPALAFLGGGIPGVIGQVVVQGGLGGLSNVFGSGNGNTNQGNNGFA